MPPPSAPDGPTGHASLRAWFGGIDIYLFDQLQRGRLTRPMRVLDAGSGGGRNLVYMLRSGYTVYGVDRSEEAVTQVRALAAQLAPSLPQTNFRVASIQALPFEDGAFEAVLSSAVLHFAASEADFASMLLEMWRVLMPGGLFFARLASSIGIEDLIQSLGGRRYHLPDGSDRYLVDEAYLVGWQERLGATLLDPIKTTNVQNQRCMTTWCLRKP